MYATAQGCIRSNPTTCQAHHISIIAVQPLSPRLAFQTPSHPRIIRTSNHTMIAAATLNPPPSQDPAKPPYTLLSSAVYSLATSDGTRRTLNLVTYASPIAIVPRYYALGFYKGTLSSEIMLATGEGVLQILGAQHAPLFQLLGKHSGRDVDKIAELHKRGIVTRKFAGQVIISDCVGAMKLKIASEPMPAGDHDVVLCSVEEFETFDANIEPLYTAQLRKEGYM